MRNLDYQADTYVHRICGQPQIEIEVMKIGTVYEQYDESDTAVQFFWQAIESFTNEQRTMFLRFVSGRSR